jgi:hypothetical protein
VNALLPGVVAGDRQKRVLTAKAQARGISFDEMEKLVFSYTSIKEYVTAEQLADLVVFVASPRGRTISGQALSVCGDTQMLGSSVRPPVRDHRLEGSRAAEAMRHVPSNSVIGQFGTLCFARPITHARVAQVASYMEVAAGAESWLPKLCHRRYSLLQRNTSNDRDLTKPMRIT